MSVLDRSYVEESFKQSIKVLTEITENEKIIDIVVNASEAVCTAYRNNKKTLFAGNGGSAADAQHFAAEFVSRFNFDRPGLPAIALSTDTSIITAIGND
jgi:D-sedoheptulose 7-phosphate isomerase